jgi:homoserine O-succinyltransferase/O-acetyltransferase
MLIAGQPSDLPLPQDEPIVIGLVNNMPDAALRATERQFHSLLSEAARGRRIRLRHFSLPQLPRAEVLQSHIREKYEDLSELWSSHFDGLIVTGTEPRASELTDEPYWKTLTKLIEWTEHHTISTVWSCLAAHAAVLHINGIARRRLPKKLFGVFNCVKETDHEIVAGVPCEWRVPHSRHNDLPEERLSSQGYRVLSRSAETGADLFIKDRGSLDIFFQGHPEYEPDTLLREYRRDVGRFLSGEKDDYPEIPAGYFDDSAAVAVTEFRQNAFDNRKLDLLNTFPKVEQNLAPSSRSSAVRLYTNWIAYLAENKHKPEG